MASNGKKRNFDAAFPGSSSNDQKTQHINGVSDLTQVAYGGMANKRPKIKEVSPKTEAEIRNMVIQIGIQRLTQESSFIHESPTYSTQFKEYNCNVEGRSNEVDQIRQHLMTCLAEGKAEPLFISGNPGCGKTATIRSVVNDRSSNGIFQMNNSQHKAEFAPFFASLNFAQCFASSSITPIYTLIFNSIYDEFLKTEIYRSMKEIGLVKFKFPDKPVGENSKTLNEESKELLPFLIQSISIMTQLYLSKQNPSYIQPQKIIILLVLDEIDHLLKNVSFYNKDLQFLFESHLESWGNVCIISVANKHDLLETMLPKTVDEKLRKIQTIQFKPYTAEQLQSIVKSRLCPPHPENDANIPLEVPTMTLEHWIDVKALKFLTIKTSKLPGEQSGDARILLDLVKSCFSELLLDSSSAAASSENGASSTSNRSIISFDLSIRIWNKFKPNIDPYLTLSLQMKSLLVILLKATKLSRGTSSSTDQGVKMFSFEAVYKSTYREIFPSVSSVSMDELGQELNLLESYGFIQITKESKKSSQRRILLKSPEQVKQSFQNDLLFKPFIEGL